MSDRDDLLARIQTELSTAQRDQAALKQMQQKLADAEDRAARALA